MSDDIAIPFRLYLPASGILPAPMTNDHGRDMTVGAGIL
jgi:hypothetical protein